MRKGSAELRAKILGDRKWLKQASDGEVASYFSENLPLDPGFFEFLLRDDGCMSISVAIAYLDDEKKVNEDPVAFEECLEALILHASAKDAEKDGPGASIDVLAQFKTRIVSRLFIEVIESGNEEVFGRLLKVLKRYGYGGGKGKKPFTNYLNDEAITAAMDYVVYCGLRNLA